MAVTSLTSLAIGASLAVAAGPAGGADLQAVTPTRAQIERRRVARMAAEVPRHGEAAKALQVFERFALREARQGVFVLDHVVPNRQRLDPCVLTQAPAGRLA